MSQPISGSYPLPALTVSVGFQNAYFHCKNNNSPCAVIGGFTLSIPAGLTANVFITHDNGKADSSSTWVQVASSLAGAQEFSYRSGSCMGIRVQYVSGSGSVLGEFTEFSGGGGGTVSQPSVVQLANRIEGENENLHRLMNAPAFNFTRITTATTTLVKTGAGIMAGIFVEAALTGTVTVYDALTAVGTPPWILPAGTVAGFHPFPWQFGVGCTVVTSAADRISVGTI